MLGHWKLSLLFSVLFSSTDGSGLQAVNRKAASKLKVAARYKRAPGAFQFLALAKILAFLVERAPAEFTSLFMFSASSSNTDTENQKHKFMLS